MDKINSRFAATTKVGKTDDFEAILDILETLPPGPRKSKPLSMHPRQVAYREAYQARYDANMARLAAERKLAEDIRLERERAAAYYAEQEAYWARLEAMNAEAEMV